MATNVKFILSEINMIFQGKLQINKMLRWNYETTINLMGEHMGGGMWDQAYIFINPYLDSSISTKRVWGYIKK